MKQQKNSFSITQLGISLVFISCLCHFGRNISPIFTIKLEATSEREEEETQELLEASGTGVLPKTDIFSMNIDLNRSPSPDPVGGAGPWPHHPAAEEQPDPVVLPNPVVPLNQEQRPVITKESLRDAVRNLKRKNGPFIPEDIKGEFWREIKGDLKIATNRRELDIKLKYHHKDLTIRKHRQKCLDVLTKIVHNNPQINPYQLDVEDSLKLFFEKKEKERGGPLGLTSYDSEVDFVKKIEKDLRNKDQYSQHIPEIFGTM